MHTTGPRAALSSHCSVLEDSTASVQQVLALYLPLGTNRTPADCFDQHPHVTYSHEVWLCLKVGNAAAA